MWFIYIVLKKMINYLDLIFESKFYFEGKKKINNGFCLVVIESFIILIVKNCMRKRKIFGNY